MSDRELILDAVGRMPAEASLAEILEELALLATVRERLAKIENGQGDRPHAEVTRMLDQWIVSAAA